METTLQLPENAYTMARKIAINTYISSCERLAPDNGVESKAFNSRCLGLVQNASSILALSVISNESSLTEIYETITNEELDVGKVFIDGAIIFNLRINSVMFEQTVDLLASSLTMYNSTTRPSAVHCTEVANEMSIDQLKGFLKENPLIVFTLLLIMEPLDHDTQQIIQLNSPNGHG